MQHVPARRCSRNRFRPRLEPLESRLTPTTFTVSTLADSGPGSLRAAIISVNADTSPDEIDFSVAGIIKLTSGALPVVTNSVNINGKSAPGYTAAPLVELDNNGFAGLTLGGPASTLAALSIVNAKDTCLTLIGGNSVVVSSYIGLALDGTAAPNQGDGIVVLSFNNAIGGVTEGAGNIISGNGQSGVFIQNGAAAETVLRGNLIGLDPTGMAAIPNQRFGVEIVGSAFNQIGGMVPGAGNVISGNLAGGVSINGFVASPLLSAPTAQPGGALPAGTYFYVITATTATGETTASVERSITLSTPGSVTLNWISAANFTNGVTGYKIYRGSAAGMENVLAAVVAGVEATSFTDADAVATPGLPPQTNTALSQDGANRNTVQGNTIGLNRTGTAAIPNLIGVLVVDARATEIGLAIQGTGNVISGNLSDGIRISGSNSINSTIFGNFIGTASDGHTAFPNGGNGVVFASGASVGSLMNNTIAENSLDGVQVQSGSHSVSITSNRIFDNGGLGIELQPGANQGQQAPVIRSAFVAQGNANITGTLTGPPNTTYLLQLYASPANSGTASGQGKSLVRQSFDTSTNSVGQADFSFVVAGYDLTVQFLTVTATVTVPVANGGNSINTSEFSAKASLASDPRAGLVIGVYMGVLNRQPSASDIQFWTALLNSGASRSILAQGVWESAEHRAVEVNQYYAQYFKRFADPGALSYWTARMQNGLSETGIQIALSTSPEYAQSRFGGDYPAALYRDVLHREPVPAELQFWVGVETSGATRAQVAAAFITSSEGYTNLLNAYYFKLLQREPDAAGLAYFLPALATGAATPQAIAETILASEEFFAMASRE